jgi:hypothetical protein
VDHYSLQPSKWVRSIIDSKKADRYEVRQSEAPATAAVEKRAFVSRQSLKAI